MRQKEGNPHIIICAHPGWVVSLMKDEEEVSRRDTCPHALSKNVNEVTDMDGIAKQNKSSSDLV